MGKYINKDDGVPLPVHHAVLHHVGEAGGEEPLQAEGHAGGDWAGERGLGGLR